MERPAAMFAADAREEWAQRGTVQRFADFGAPPSTLDNKRIKPSVRQVRLSV